MIPRLGFIAAALRPALARHVAKVLSINFAVNGSKTELPENETILCTFHCDEPNSYIHRIEQYDVLIRGYVALPGSQSASSATEVAQAVVALYRRNESLTGLKFWDGSFTLALYDRSLSRVLVHRSIGSHRFTYFMQTPDGCMAAGNLATLHRCFANYVTENKSQHAALFLFRWVPGSDTAFEQVKRLLPGQSLDFDAINTRVRQDVTLQDLRLNDPPRNHRDAVKTLNDVMQTVSRDVHTLDPAGVTLLSGGVDSSLIHGHWSRIANIAVGSPASVSITTNDPLTQNDANYALSAAKHFGTLHECFTMQAPYETHLSGGISALAEPPNHVQGVFYRDLARRMADTGINTGLCGEGADCLFGSPWADTLWRAQRIHRYIPTGTMRSLGATAADSIGKTHLAETFRIANVFNDFQDLEHPVNRCSVWTHMPTVQTCFSMDEICAAHAYRRDLLNRYEVNRDPWRMVHELTLLGEVMDSASLWTGLLHVEGVDLICPFLDSRVMRFALSLPLELRFQWREPKKILKDALVEFMPRELVYRPKLAFGQPVFDWMAEAGEIRHLVDRINSSDYSFLSHSTLETIKSHPNWFLFTLVCLDVWRREFL